MVTPTKNWDLYIVAPKIKRREEPSTIWIQLRGQHYTWLKPKPTKVLSTTDRQRWQAQAVYKPFTASQGGGRSTTSSELSALGLNWKRNDDSSRRGTQRGRANTAANSNLTHTDVDAKSCTDTLSILGLQRLRKRPAGTSHDSELSALGLRNYSKRLKGHDAQSTATITDEAINAIDEESHQFDCPCGKWNPPPELNYKDRRKLAMLHWRTCQGTQPPVKGRHAKRHNGTITTAKANEALRSNAQRKFTSWHQQMCKKHAKFKDTCCDFDLDARMVKTYARKNLVNYLCRRCGKYSILPHLRHTPCRARTTAITPYTFRCWTMGRTYADKKSKDHQKASLKCFHKRPKSDEAKDAYIQYQRNLRKRHSNDRYQTWYATMEGNEQTAGAACKLKQSQSGYLCERCNKQRTLYGARYHACSQQQRDKPLTHQQYCKAVRKADRSAADYSRRDKYAKCASKES